MAAPFAIHHHGQIISRSSGRSATAAAAYRTGQRIVDERTGEIHDYTRKRGVVFAETLIPNHAPAHLADASTLWNLVEQTERNANDQLCREFNIDLPRELSEEQNKALAREYVTSVFVKKGMCATWAYHDPDEHNSNPHIHVMLTMREVLPSGKFASKVVTRYLCRNAEGEERALTPDEFGKLKKEGFEKVYPYKGKRELTQSEAEGIGLHPTKDRIRKQPINHDEKRNDWDDDSNMDKWREAWANTANKHLRLANISKEYDHRSYERRGVERIPQIHLGPSAHNMELRGVESARGEQNRQIEKLNEYLKDEILPQKTRQAILEKGYELNRGHFNDAQEVREFTRPLIEHIQRQIDRVREWVRNAAIKVLESSLCRTMVGYARQLREHANIQIAQRQGDLVYSTGSHSFSGRDLDDRLTKKNVERELEARNRNGVRLSAKKNRDRGQEMQRVEVSIEIAPNLARESRGGSTVMDTTLNKKGIEKKYAEAREKQRQKQQEEKNQPKYTYEEIMQRNAERLAAQIEARRAAAEKRRERQQDPQAGIGGMEQGALDRLMEEGVRNAKQGTAERSRREAARAASRDQQSQRNAKRDAQNKKRGGGVRDDR